MTPLLFFLINITLKQISDQPIIIDGISDIYASEFIFISSPYGIYTFDRNSETWGRITQANGLPDNEIDIIGLDEGILWVATPKGLASADVRINDWQTYEMPGKIEGLAFDDEYVWAGGKFGLKRFDKYLETWEDITTTSINHIFTERNYIWFATDSGIVRFNQEFEKIENVHGSPKDHYDHIINTPGKIWFIAPDTFVSYEKQVEKWSTYNGFEINDYSNLGDSLFVVSKGKVYFYDPRSDNWILFRDIEGLDNVNGISVVGQNILFAMDDGLFVYDWNERSRKSYNRSNGLEIDSLFDVFQDKKYIFVFNQHNIEFLDRNVNIWKVEKLKAPGKRKKQLLYVDEAGGHVNLIKDFDMKLQGRTDYSQTYLITDSVSWSDNENINLKLIGQHKSDRLFSVYYDDTDKDQLMYGFGYRGLNNDLFYKWNGGYIKSEYYEFNLIPEYSILGTNAKVRYKTHSIDIQGGQLKSQLRTDFFFGRATEHNYTILDTAYVKNTFYYIYSTARSITKKIDTIFVDDGLQSTNSIDTRIGYSVAGLTGDFDPFINGIDYMIDYEQGIIHFLNPRQNTDIIVLLLNNQEIIIQSNTISGRILENIYFIGPNIIPNSFSMTVIDTLGQIHDLTEFGLDNDGDNQVDPQFFNHDLGYLIFPQSRPFPDEVYDDTLHIYTLNIQFRSQSVFYKLSYSPILIGSEIVNVDGELMTKGTHYVVDYTTGILLFLREDVISDFSEIEVHYSSVEREREEILYAAQPKISIGNSIAIAPGFSAVDDKRIAHISGKLQTGAGSDKGLKFIPQVAIEKGKAWAQNYSLIANYNILNLHAEYKGFSDDYETFGLNEKKYGKLQHSGTFTTSIEPFTYIRVDGQFKKEYQIDSLDSQHIAQYTYGKINYLNPKVPNGYILIGRNYLPDYEKDRIQLHTNYDFEFMKSKMKLNSILRSVNIALGQNNTNDVIDYIISSNFSLPFPLHSALYVRHSDLYSNNLKEKNEQEIRSTLNIDLIPGLYYTGTYNLQTTTFYLDISQDLNLEHYFYNNLNIAPGRWYSYLSMVNFSVGTGNNFEEYLRNLPAHYKRKLIVFKPLEDGFISSIRNTNNYYATIQFTPFSNVLIWEKHTLGKSGSIYYALPEVITTLRDEIRIEYEPKNLGIFISSWDHRKISSYPIITTDNLYFEWSKPWSASLRTKFFTNYRSGIDDYGIISTYDSEVRTNFETLLRFGSNSYVTLNLGGSRQINTLNESNYSIIPGAGFNINLFRFLYLQFDYESTFALGGPASHILSAKATGQF